VDFVIEVGGPGTMAQSLKGKHISRISS